VLQGSARERSRCRWLPLGGHGVWRPYHRVPRPS
jgi:hypothetical protein